MRTFFLGGTRDLAGWFNAAKWLDALPLKLCSDPIVEIATAPQLSSSQRPSQGHGKGPTHLASTVLVEFDRPAFRVKAPFILSGKNRAKCFVHVEDIVVKSDLR
jgi:hypothetical protein